MTLRPPHRLIQLLLVVALSPAAWAAERPAPRVVARGARKLEHALQLATYEAWRDPAQSRPVALVIDSTPYTAFAAYDLAAALLALDEKVGDAPATWRIGRLGTSLAPPDKGPGKASRRLRAVLAEESKVTSTFHALRRTLSRFREPGGVVVYLADRHFEDHAELEAFVDLLAERGQRFSVLGPEAGLLQPYDDACFPEGGGPFGPSSEASPWHTGDTAWPHLPGRVTTNTWYFHQTVGLPLDLVDRLRAYVRRERLGRAPDRETFLRDLDSSAAPRVGVSTVTPSSYGPYGLMRACAVTGGTYCLWSWNPLSRPGPVYDYGRCNALAPDLRSVSQIRADIPRRPLARALLRAWRAAASHHVSLATYTPPAEENGHPRAVERIAGARLPLPWRDARSRDLFLQGMDRRLGRLDSAIEDLERVLAAASAADEVDRRYRADADLFLHVLRLHRFHEAERLGAFLAFEAAPPARDRGDRLVWQPQTWVHGGPSPATLRLAHVQPHNSVAARAILAAHREILERYVGTPYAELVSHNGIHTYRIVPRERDRTPPGARGPSRSRGREPGSPVTPGPGGSTGGGPTTGR